MSDAKTDNQALQIVARKDDTEAKAVARAAIEPVSRNAMAARQFMPAVFKNADLNECAVQVREAADRINGGDLAGVEQTLTAQLHVLDAVFTKTAMLASTAEHVETMEAFLRMAMKAQAQARATAETLTEMKYPKSATFIRQQNVAGQQIVNNADKMPAHGKTEEHQTGLLEASYGERLDFGATETTSGTHPKLEALGEVNRPQNRRRKAGDKPERAEAWSIRGRLA